MTNAGASLGRRHACCLDTSDLRSGLLSLWFKNLAYLQLFSFDTTVVVVVVVGDVGLVVVEEGAVKVVLISNQPHAQVESSDSRCKEASLLW